jgi:hypothetical protein
VRTVNQRRPGAYEFSASKVVGGDAASIVAAFTSARRRARWTAAADPALRSALAASFGAGASAGFAVKANGRARHRYTWDGSTVEIYVDPKGTGRCSVVVQHLKLPSRAALEDRRRQWRAALAALAALFSS